MRRTFFSLKKKPFFYKAKIKDLVCVRNNNNNFNWMYFFFYLFFLCVALNYIKKKKFYTQLGIYY